MNLFKGRSMKPLSLRSKKALAFLLMAGATVAATLTISRMALAGPTVTVGMKSSSHVAIDKIDHSAWDALLRKYVDENGFVNYRAWQASAQDRQHLTAYLNRLSGANPTLPSRHDAKLAFWINAYNAVTVDGILREYPTSSIRNHTSKVGGYNIWDDLHLIGRVEKWRGGLGVAYRFPALSFAGASLAPPCSFFHFPLIEPGVRFSRTGLSDKGLMLSPTEGCASTSQAGPDRVARSGSGRGIVTCPDPAFCVSDTTIDGPDCGRDSRSARRVC